MSRKGAPQVGLASPGDEPEAPVIEIPEHIRRPLLLEEGAVITKEMSRASVAMYEAMAGGKRFSYSTCES
jgi:hypothetical protein